MTAPRWPLLVLALAALALARKRPALRPAAVALSALACIDLARIVTTPVAQLARTTSVIALLLPEGLGLDAFVRALRWWVRTDVAMWLAWPGISAALAWRVWRGRAWPVALAFAAYAAAVALVPVTWGPLTWWAASRAPFWLSPAAALVAWGTRKDEGPEAEAPNPSCALQDRPNPLRASHRRVDRSALVQGTTRHDEHCAAPSPAAQASREVAALLAWSGLVDVLVGALSPSGSHDLAAPIAWATWALVGRALLRTR
jgi:hypothetical protein